MSKLARFFLFLLSATLCAPAFGQANAPASKFPAPAVGEFGPREAVDDGLDINQYLSGDGTYQTPSGVPDTVGAFRFICGPGQNLADDPVVYPGQKGKSHGHQFYGNLKTDWTSTYDSQRTSGDTTCQNITNRSGYWITDMRMPFSKKVARPTHISIYYKREPKGSPECTPGDPKFVGECVGIPNALRFIFGTDLVSFTQPTGAVKFKCTNPAGTINRSSFDPNARRAAGFCQVGDKFDVAIDAPACWNGKDLNSPNHRSHMAYQGPDYKCPPTHPKYIPHFTLQSYYDVNAELDRSGNLNVTCSQTWCFSSDIDFGKLFGETMHADYFEAWNAKIKKAWQHNCIDKLLNCSGGDLGNGYGMRQIYPLTYAAQPLIPAPAKAYEPFVTTIGHTH